VAWLITNVQSFRVAALPCPADEDGGAWGSRRGWRSLTGMKKLDRMEEPAAE
jgi:hypothetical protein